MANYEEYNSLIHGARLEQFRKGLDEMARQAKGKPFTHAGSIWTMNREGQLLSRPLQRDWGRRGLAPNVLGEAIDSQERDMPFRQLPLDRLEEQTDIEGLEK